MEENNEYRKALLKLIGKDVEFAFEPVKVNFSTTITRVTTYNGFLVLYERGFKYDNNDVTAEMLKAVFCAVLAIRTETTEKILAINKELLALGGYNVKYYKAEEWRKSFSTYNINRLIETLSDYELQLKRKKDNA